MRTLCRKAWPVSSFFKAVLKQKLLAPILQVVFPILSATPPPGEEDPEDEENAEGDNDSQSPKHFAAQVTLTPYTLWDLLQCNLVFFLFLVFFFARFWLQSKYAVTLHEGEHSAFL